MVTKLWVQTALRCLQESLQPVAQELNELDWKLGATDNKQRLTEHLAAFANYSGGGVLAFGINDDGRVAGIAEDAIDSIVNKLANLGRDALEPALALDHAIVSYADQTLLLVRIPEQTVKPVHLRGKSVESTWVRSGGTTRKASRQEVGALMLDSQTPCWEDLRACQQITFEKVIELLDLPAVARLLDRPLPEEPERLASWLVDEGIVVADGRGYCVTNFGAIAAARNVEDFPRLARKRVRVIRYQGRNKVDTIDEWIEPGGYAVSFEALVEYLKRMLPHSEVIHQALRVDVSVYPEIALRELIANALIHQDFSITGTGPLIELFDDRIEFTSPGGLLPGKHPDRLIGATPESRNENLASSFRRFRICEERGTGFQKVVQAIELFGLPPLIVRTEDKAFRTALGAPLQFADMAMSARVEASYQHAVLQYFSNQTMTNTTLRERFKLNEKQRNQVTNVIAEAVAAGRIRRKDPGSGNKFAEYLPYWS